MFIKKHGDGNNIYVGFHGWSGDHRTFDPIVFFLNSNSTFFTYDLPGCGNSPVPETWDEESLISTLSKSISTIANSPVTFIGNCSGAILGLMIAKKEAHIFKHLILIDPFAYMPWYFSIFLNKYFGKEAYNITFANPIGRWITNASLKTKRTDKSNLTKSFEEVNHQSVYQYLKLLDGVKNPFQFSGISMPIDILYGERTFRAVKKSLEIWKKVFPQAYLHELKGTGHLPIEEASKQVAEIIFKKG